ncbi:unnamed protein product [Lactuca saligna]|uniref:Uncharacterized protein n=1 Tax=Lactuca saligna TaxID=75948 RepID=A0AA35Z3G2_LACSI|nr:unnamed protein product [Lactuca saligna]
MRNTRTSSFKLKFKNTQETVLNLDEDDDDFVALPIEYEAEGVRSEQIDRNIVGSRKTKKQKKKTSRSEHAKNNVESGKSDVNKNKEETIPSDNTFVRRMKRKGFARSAHAKDSNKSSEASGERKKTKKSKCVTFGEYEWVVNDAHSKKSPKRKKGKIGHENVNIKTKEEKVRKVSKDHPEGYRRLATRMTPDRISAAVKVMSPAQKLGLCVLVLVHF